MLSLLQIKQQKKCKRVSKTLGSSATGLSWLGTFHSICAKLLRKHASAVGLNSNFTIIDTDDQIRLIKNICKSENIDVKQISPKYIIAIIDKMEKSKFITQMKLLLIIKIFMKNLYYQFIKFINKN